MTERFKSINVSMDFRENSVKNFAVECRSSAPDTPRAGSIYYDTTLSTFRYYDGTNWMGLPYLDNGKIPTSMLNTILSSGSLIGADDTTVPTSGLMSNVVGTLIPASSKVTSWSTPTSNDNIPSEKLTKDSIDAVDTKAEGKIDLTALVTSWSTPVSDANVPSEKLTKDTIDTKIDTASITQSITTGIDTIPSNMAVKSGLDTKTDITMAIHNWNSTTTYSTDSTVLAGARLFISLVDNNINHDPLDDLEHIYWAMLSVSSGGGLPGAVNGKSIQFGNDHDTEYTLTHNLSSYDLLWSVRETASPREYITTPRIQAINKSNVKVITQTAPGDNALTINLVALRSSVTPSIIDVVSITTASTTWTYANDTNNPLFVQTYDDTGNQIMGDVQQVSVDDFDPVTVTFTNAEAGDIIVVKSPYVFEFNNLSTWVVNHSLGVYVAVQCYNDVSGQIQGTVLQNGYSAVITWDAPKSGYAICAVPSLAQDFAGQSTWTFVHNLNRTVGIQTFDTTGNQIFGNITQTGNSVTVTFTNVESGTMLII